MVYTNTLATVMRQIQQAENSMPAMVIIMEAARVDNTIHLDYLTSKVALEEHEIGTTDPNIPIDNNCMDDKLHFRMPGGSRDIAHERDECDNPNAIPTASQRRQAATELERVHQEPSVVDGYEGEDGDDADVDQQEEASQAHDGSTQNVEN
jgi:hypothetical protein